MIEEHSHIGAKSSWVDLGGGTRAFLAVPRRFEAPYPAVVLSPEQAGVEQHTQDLAAKFASFGYVAIAPEISSPAADRVKADMSKAMDYIKGLPEVEASRIAAFGSGQSAGYPHLLNSVRPDVAANIVFYGGTDPEDQIIRAVTAPTLGIFGETDETISLVDVRAFRAKLEEHRKNYDFKVFADVPHDWLNDSMPSRYRQKESEEAWAFMLGFLDRVYSEAAYPAGRVRWRMATDYVPR